MGRYFTERRLPPADRRRLLADILERAGKMAPRRAVVVFDLDGTLMDNRPRTVAILQELAEHWRPHRPSMAELLARARTESVAYGLVENLRELGVEDEHEHAFDFWKERFFSDPYMKHDVEVPGAVAYARRLYEAGANLVYLTGRDLPGMSLGTFASLRDLGFPIGMVGTELVTKPDFDTPDTAFKQNVADALTRVGDVLAVFDNEPANCNLLLEAHPSCFSVFVDTLYAPDPPPLREEVYVIDSFEM